MEIVPDRSSGDGDCGSSFKRLSDFIIQHVKENNDRFSYENTANLPDILKWLSLAFEYMSGSAGGVLSLGCNYAAVELSKGDLSGTKFSAKVCKISSWMAMAMSKYGGAKKDDKTLLDMFLSLAENQGASGSQDLENGMLLTLEATKDMVPLSGRAAYTGKADGQYDPGCFVIFEIFKLIFAAERKWSSQ